MGDKRFNFSLLSFPDAESASRSIESHFARECCESVREQSPGGRERWELLTPPDVWINVTEAEVIPRSTSWTIHFGPPGLFTREGILSLESVEWSYDPTPVLIANYGVAVYP